MKHGAKFVDKQNRRRVTVTNIYTEDISGKTVINFRHGHDKFQIGARYKDDFLNHYRPLKTKK